MTTIHARTIDQVLSATVLPKVACNNQNTVRFHVEFDEKWDGYEKTAIFYTSKDPTPYEKMLSTDGICYVPPEVLTEAGHLFISLRGVSAGKVKTSTVLRYKLLLGTPSMVISDPTDDVYQQLLSAYGDTNTKINTNTANLDAQIDTVESNLASKIEIEKNERLAEIAVERERINNFASLSEGSTTGDAELTDIRVAYAGNYGTVANVSKTEPKETYSTAGEAVRSQVNWLSDELSAFRSKLTPNFEIGTISQGVKVDAAKRIRFTEKIAAHRRTIVSLAPNNVYKYGCSVYDENGVNDGVDYGWNTMNPVNGDYIEIAFTEGYFSLYFMRTDDADMTVNDLQALSEIVTVHQFDALKDIAELKNDCKKIENNTHSIVKNRAFDYENIKIYEASGYVQADGEPYVNETDYHCKYTQKIPCVSGDVFSYLGVGQFNAVSYIFYNGDSIVSTGQVYSANAVTPKVVKIPSGVDGVVFASYSRIAEDVVLEIEHCCSPIYEQVENITERVVAGSNMVVDALLDLVTPQDIEIKTAEWTPNYYYAYDGKIVGYENISMGKIAVSAGEILTIRSSYWSAAALYGFTDKANIRIATFPYVLQTEANAQSATVTVVVPANAAYLYINDLSAKIDGVSTPNVWKIKSFQRAAHSKNVLEGKTYVAVGDSYTEGDFSGWQDENGLTYENSPVIYDTERMMYKTYPWWIAERNNMILYNRGRCGSIVALDKDYVDGVEGVEITSREPFAYTRYKELPDNIDYMTFWFGINDAGHTHLGTIDDTDNTTFYGAWNVVLPYLIEKYPLCKMGFIVTTGANSAYRQAIRDVACKWGVPYLDLTGDAGVPMMNGRESSVGVCDEAVQLRRNAFMLENGHFNVEGHKYESTFIENFLRSL